jgi:hypothetical protein
MSYGGALTFGNEPNAPVSAVPEFGLAKFAREGAEGILTFSHRLKAVGVI